MKQNQFSRRINELAREKLSYILLFEISDPDLALVTITGVEVSVDKSYMRIYVAAAPEDYEAVEAGFKRARGRIRTALGRALKWRHVPELDFRIDTTTDEAQAIAEALTHVPATLAVEKDEFGYPIEDETSKQ